MHWLKHAADPCASGKMHVLPDLRAGSNGSPSVHHGALVNVRAEIHETGHQNDRRRDVSRLAHDAIRNGSKACGVPFRLAPSQEFRIDLVPPCRSLRSAFLRHHVADPESKHYGKFCPLVDPPVSLSIALGNSERARVQRVKRFLDGVARVSPRIRRNCVTHCPSIFDALLQIL